MNIACQLSPTTAFTRTPGENVGSYLIVPESLTSGNYAIAFNTDTLPFAVNPADLIGEVTANRFCRVQVRP